MTANKSPRIFCIANQKGGVGKTTTAVNLSTALAACRKKVLLIDLDPQGNASTGLGVKRASLENSTYDLLFDDKVELGDVIKPTKVPRLDLAPSSIHLSGAEIELIDMEEREYILRRKLSASDGYDYIIIDCPPSLSLLTLNAFVASNAIIVPLQCEFYALEGLSHLARTVGRIRESFNNGLDIHGIVMTMFDRRNRLSEMVEQDVREHFGDQVYKTVIPRNVRLSEAPSYGLPAIIYDMKCAGAKAYIKLAREILQREKERTAKLETKEKESGNTDSETRMIAGGQ